MDPTLYRAVPLAEIENAHIFRSLRHFPDLRVSVGGLKELQLNNGRDLKTSTREFQHFRRKKQLKFTHHLENLTRTSLGEINTLKEFRTIICEERIKKRAEELPQPPSRPISPKLLTPSENLASANAKLTKFAISYSSQSFINILAGFQGHNDSGGWITKDELDVQLRRCLNIKLRREELDALFVSIDDNSNGLIEGVEFTRYFFKLGNEARQKIKLENEARLNRQQEKMRLKGIEEMERIKRWEAEQAARWERAHHEYSESSNPNELLETLLEKLSLIAVELVSSQNCVTSNITRGFENHLTALELKRQIEISFGVSLTSPEIGVLVSKFSTLEGPHCIDGGIFLKSLYVLGQKIQKKKMAERLRIAKLNREKFVLSRNQKSEVLPKCLGR